MNNSTSEELHKILLEKPVLTNPKDKIKFITFYALACRGWKGVGSSYSGVMTKNGFVLTLYRSDASRFQLSEPSSYLVPAAISVFTVPNASWVLERYNKLYDSGKIQTIWDYLYDTPEAIDNSPMFLKFIEQVDALASLQEIELQSLGSYYIRNSEPVTTFLQYDGNIADTGIFTPLTDFCTVQKGNAYKILSAVNEKKDEKYFVLKQISPSSSIESSISLTDFYDHYQSGEIIPLRIVQTNTEDYRLVKAGGVAMGGIPSALLQLNFSQKRQKVLGIAIIEKLYILPLLTANEDILEDVLELLRNSTEYEILYQLPDNQELIQVMLEYAKAGFSLYRPFTLADAAEARFELGELLESATTAQENIRQQFNIAVAELMQFLRTSYLSTTPVQGIKANYLYVNALKESGIMTNLIACLLKNTISDASGALYLHKVYLDFKAQTEIRSFFYENGLDDLLERSLAESTHISFDWRIGFGLNCDNYILIRIPGGYRVQNKDNVICGFLLNVNGTVISYGDLSVLKQNVN